MARPPTLCSGLHPRTIHFNPDNPLLSKLVLYMYLYLFFYISVTFLSLKYLLYSLKLPSNFQTSASLFFCCFTPFTLLPNFSVWGEGERGDILNSVPLEDCGLQENLNGNTPTLLRLHRQLLSLACFAWPRSNLYPQDKYLAQNN